MLETDKIYLWNEINFSGTQFPYLPDPEMLIGEGVVKIRTVKQYRHSEVKTFNVCYNRDYVVQYLAEKAFKSLGAINYDELIKLIKDSLSLRESLIAEKLKEYGGA